MTTGPPVLVHRERMILLKGMIRRSRRFEQLHVVFQPILSSIPMNPFRFSNLAGTSHNRQGGRIRYELSEFGHSSSLPWGEIVELPWSTLLLSRLLPGGRGLAIPIRSGNAQGSRRLQITC